MDMYFCEQSVRGDAAVFKRRRSGPGAFEGSGKDGGSRAFADSDDIVRDGLLFLLPSVSGTVCYRMYRMPETGDIPEHFKQELYLLSRKADGGISGEVHERGGYGPVALPFHAACVQGYFSESSFCGSRAVYFKRAYRGGDIRPFDDAALCAEADREEACGCAGGISGSGEGEPCGGKRLAFGNGGHQELFTGSKDYGTVREKLQQHDGCGGTESWERSRSF